MYDDEATKHEIEHVQASWRVKPDSIKDNAVYLLPDGTQVQAQLFVLEIEGVYHWNLVDPHTDEPLYNLFSSGAITRYTLMSREFDPDGELMATYAQESTNLTVDDLRLLDTDRDARQDEQA
jgi:hypothetical protein